MSPAFFDGARSGVSLPGLKPFSMARTILVVEDNDGCRDALEVAFTKLPEFAVRAVATAEEALECLAAGDICALVTDLHLGPMDGFDLIASVRSHPGGTARFRSWSSAEIPTPLHPPGSRAWELDAYFSKPYSPAAVCSKLEQLVHAN